MTVSLGLKWLFGQKNDIYFSLQFSDCWLNGAFVVKKKINSTFSGLDIYKTPGNTHFLFERIEKKDRSFSVPWNTKQLENGVDDDVDDDKQINGQEQQPNYKTKKIFSLTIISSSPPYLLFPLPVQSLFCSKNCYIPPPPGPPPTPFVVVIAIFTSPNL